MPVDAEIAAIDKELSERGIPRAELGRRLGLDSSQVSRLFSGRRRLQRHEMNTIREWLYPGAAGAPASATIVPMPGMVPLYGWVGAASAQRLTFAEQTIRGYVPMHPGQVGAVHPFALEVSDISMSPRYEPGEIVYVAPNRWPTRGQDCVVVTATGEGFLKRYLGRDQVRLRCHQLNPETDVDFDLAQVASVHAVVGRG